MKASTWLWSAWGAALATCPIAMLYIEVAYPDMPSHPPPWSGPIREIYGVLEAHYWISIVAAVVLLAWERRWWVVLPVWFGVGSLWLVNAFLGMLNMFGKTGANF